MVVAGVLLYLALRGVDWSAARQAMASANYAWLPALAGVLVGSHVIRAWRWTLLLDTPSEDASALANAPRYALWRAVRAVFAGYLVNYAAPRVGEFVRAGYAARETPHAYAHVLGTVVAERLLDVLMLALGLVTLVPLYGDDLATLFAPLLSAYDTSTLVFATAGLGALGLAGLGALWWLFRSNERIAEQARRFGRGLSAVARSPHRAGIVLSTLAMWGAYGLMAWLPFLFLGTATTYGIGLLDAWGLMLIGAIGVAIPSPGGVGTYHYATITALAALYAMPATPAATYALVSHTGQLLMVVLVGGAFVALGRGLPQHAAPESPRDSPPAPHA